MKKVALMTWFHYRNFGTALQAVALSQTIRDLGCDCQIMQYIPTGKVVRQLRNDPLSLFRYGTARLIARRNRAANDTERETRFERFIAAHLTLTEPRQTSSELYALNGRFDAFLCGSDQIWAPSCFDSKYFLDFVEDPGKMVAYAPSIGRSNIADIAEPHVVQQMASLIARFEHLSVREAQGRQIIRDLGGGDASVVLDPTLLFTTDQWDTYASEAFDAAERPGPYLLCYFLGNSSYPWKRVKEIAKRHKLLVVVVPVHQKDFGRGDFVAAQSGPAEFLSLVKNADFICTDSFHGTIFAIQYEVPFHVFERFSPKDKNSQNSRVDNLLWQTGLESRLVKWRRLERTDQGCDFRQAHERLAAEREKSILFLREALRLATLTPPQSVPSGITNTCCGCGACAVACPAKAIRIEENHQGFLAASLCAEKCLRCGVCKQVCPYNGQPVQAIDKQRHTLYMLRSTRQETLHRSSSGGAGYEIAELLREQGYDLAGCVYDVSKAEAAHVRVPTGQTDGPKRFQGSKYLQSRTHEAFQEVLDNPSKTAIFGTPCQIAGMDRLLRRERRRDDCILVDLICHGVPTQHLWRKYIREIKRRYSVGSEAEVNFRFKAKSWEDKYMRIAGAERVYCRLETKDLFYRFFLSRHCDMSACYECNFRTASAADVRIGDYWGPRYENDSQGTSMVLALTDSGTAVLGRLRDLGRVELNEFPCGEYWTVQYPQNPVKPVFYDALISELANPEYDLSVVARRYCRSFEVKERYREAFRKIRALRKFKK
jgi:coenzyme F420-reducing hydrogenase beta subunit